jgi:fumarate hydratase subunit alpha
MDGYRALVEMLEELVRVATTRLPLDVYTALQRALEAEEEPLARAQLEAMLRNAELAAERGAPICQDTGVPFFYMRVGADYPLRARVYEAAAEAVRRATRSIPLRPNAVDPLGGGNTGDNTGRYLPWVEAEIVPGNRLEAVYAPKGGGSEAVTRVMVATPLEAEEKLLETVLTAVAEAGPRPCPPLVLGVGIGPTGDTALRLAKGAALLRPLSSPPPDPRLQELEARLLEKVNMLGIGPQGFGGRTTALAVHVDYAHRHPATFAVGVVASCWALRRAAGVIDERGEWRLTSRHI